MEDGWVPNNESKLLRLIAGALDACSGVSPLPSGNCLLRYGFMMKEGQPEKVFCSNCGLPSSLVGRGDGRSEAVTRDNNCLPDWLVDSLFIRESRSWVNSSACTSDPTSLLTTSFRKAVASTTAFWDTPKAVLAIVSTKTTRPALPGIPDSWSTRSTWMACSANFLVMSIVAISQQCRVRPAIANDFCHPAS